MIRSWIWFWVSVVGAVTMCDAMLRITWVSRPGILAGVFVGNANWTSAEAEDIRRRWQIESRYGALGAAAAGLVASAAYRIVWMTLLTAALIWLASLVCYLRAHRSSQGLALSVRTRHARVASGGFPGRAALAGKSMPVVGSLAAWAATANTVPAGVRYDHASLASLTLMAAVLAASSASSYTWRAGESERSRRARESFWVRYGAVCLAVAAMGAASLLALGFAATRLQLGPSTLRQLLGAATSGIILIAFGLWGVMARSLGQGGALQEVAADGELIDPSTDNTRWFRGVIYYNPADSRLWVERRVGLGVTPNQAHLLGWLMVAAGLAWGGLVIAAFMES